ncbi:MAG: hypothetical protein HYT62_01915 [Candidatus Yanofskybacteria bacterium]|nr:hypothetical protein [Candidatus Yanofskybacteria bacterium]
MSSKPLFTWVPAPDGRMRTHRELVDHCVTVQEFFFLLREKGMDRDQAQRAYADLLVDMKSILAENGICVIEPQWFASLLR